MSNVKPGISTTDQREEGFKLAMRELFPNVDVLDTQFNDDDANKSASQLQAVFARNPDLAGVFGANLFSAIGAADGVKALGKSGEIKVVAFDTPTRIVDDIKSGLIDLAIAPAPGRDRLLWRRHRLCRAHRSIDSNVDRYRFHRHALRQHRRSGSSELRLFGLIRKVGPHSGPPFGPPGSKIWTPCPSWLFVPRPAGAMTMPS